METEQQKEFPIKGIVTLILVAILAFGASWWRNHRTANQRPVDRHFAEELLTTVERGDFIYDLDTHRIGAVSEVRPRQRVIVVFFGVGMVPEWVDVDDVATIPLRTAIIKKDDPGWPAAVRRWMGVPVWR